MKSTSYDINKIMLISGIPDGNFEFIQKKNEEISNLFIISQNYLEKINNKNFIVIKGKIINGLKNDILDLRIKFQYPNKSLSCNLKSGSKFVQVYIKCEVFTWNIKFIFVKNQVIYSKSLDYNLLLIF